MYYFYFDSGTTNTRGYLLHGSTILCHSDISVGSRDSALACDKKILIGALKQLYDQLLCRYGVPDSEVHSIYMSGMISCPSGMVEIEHLSTPVNFQTLKSHITTYFEEAFFKRNIYLIPGIKTLPRGTTASMETVAVTGNMRGEETEIFGMLHRHPSLAKGNSIFILPGSHTQVAFLNDGSIENISSNVTGELYHALISETILGSSLIGEEKTPILPPMVCMGYETVHRYGFNRALYMVRSMDLFSDFTLAQRRSYMEGVLNGGVMDAIVQIMQDSPGTLAVAGPHVQYEIYSALSLSLFPQFHVMEIPVIPELPFAVEGFLSLMEL